MCSAFVKCTSPEFGFQNISLIIIVIVVYIESVYVFYLLLRNCCAPTQRRDAATNTAVCERSLSLFPFLSVARVYAVVCARRVALMLYSMFIHSIVYSTEYEYIDTLCMCVLVLVCYSFVCQTDSSARFVCSGLQPIFRSIYNSIHFKMLIVDQLVQSVGRC